MSTKIKKIIIATVPYILIGLVATNIGEAMTEMPQKIRRIARNSKTKREIPESTSPVPPNR